MHAKLNHTNVSSFDSVNVAQLKSAWEELFKQNLEAHIKSAQSGADVNRLSITAPISAESEYKGYTDGVTEEGAVRYSIAS